MSLQSRYTILRKIADGGTAEIFLAKQHGAQGFEKMVVLKRILSTFYADPQFRHLLVDEAHVAMSLSHSNIVQVLDLGEADGRYFLALELVDGWTLDKVLRRAKAAGVPFPPALALYVTAEVCRALGYAHGKQRNGKPLEIVHRDISPHNVMLSAEGEVKVTDFGIAKAQNKKEKSLGKLIKGKIAFMSPEQASGADDLDARSDLFSAGTMLYVMITRRLPFDAPTDYETLMQVKGGDYLPPETARPGLNPELYRVIRKAMGKSAADRYQKADEMLLDVEQVMRLAFRPVGQTELQRWLSDLTAKDGVPSLTRDAPTTVSGPPSTVGPLDALAQLDGPRAGAGAGASADSGRVPQALASAQESGLILDLADAVEVSAGIGAPPPTPSSSASAPSMASAPATEVMLNPASFSWAEPWYKRRGARIGGGVALVLVLALSASALMHGGGRRRAETAAPAPSAASPSTSGTAQAAPAAPAPPPEAAKTPVTAPAAAVAAEVAPTQPPRAAAPDEAPPVVAARVEPKAAPAPAAEEPEERPGADSANEGEAEDTSAAEGARARSVSVMVKSDPEGSKVSTRHHSYGTTPVSLKLRPGNMYDLTFTKAGYGTTSKRYHVTEKGAQVVRVSLKKSPEPASAHRAPSHAGGKSASAQSSRNSDKTADKIGNSKKGGKSAPAADSHPSASSKKKADWFAR